MHKNVVTVVIVVIILAASSVPVSAAGKIAASGQYYYTDITTYLWDKPVNAINTGGITFIDAESMVYYGIEVTWHPGERWLEITDNETQKISPEAADGSLLDMSSGRPGTVAGKYYKTDIKTTLNGLPIININIGGRTFIGAEAMRDFGYDVIWDGVARTLSISKNINWWIDIYNSYYDGNATKVLDGFSFNLERTTGGGCYPFGYDISDFSGEYAAIHSIGLSNRRILVSFYMQIEEYGEFFYDLWKCVSIEYGERIAEDTPELREAIKKVYRVYVNGEFACGEIYRSQGNGHTDFALVFDEPLNYKKTDTVRIEVGYEK